MLGSLQFQSYEICHVHVHVYRHISKYGRNRDTAHNQGTLSACKAFSLLFLIDFGMSLQVKLGFVNTVTPH